MMYRSSARYTARADGHPTSDDTGMQVGSRWWYTPDGWLPPQAQWPSHTDREGYGYRACSPIPTARGQGIARRLLAYLEDLARQSHLPEVHLGVRLSLPRNMELYQGLGYQMRSIHPYPEATDTWAWLAKPVEGGPDHGPG
jgi:hypothetical protein